MTGEDEFLTINEAAQFLKVSKTSLRRWTANGRLRCYRVGYRSERRFLVADLLAFLEDSAGTENGATVARSRLPRHICSQFKNSEEQWQLLSPYLFAHIQPETKTVYVYDKEDGAKPVAKLLATKDFDAVSLMQQGRLKLIHASESYLAGGFFDSDRMLQFWQSEISQSKDERVNRLLLTGEMGWAASGAPGCGELLPYEARLDAILEQHPWVTILCQYALQDFPAATIFESLCLHPRVRLPGRTVAGLGSTVDVFQPEA